MAHTFRERISTFRCPHCGNVVKVSRDSESLMVLLIILFPIGIIYWIINFLISKKKEKTYNGDEIVICSNCYKKVVIHNDTTGIGSCTTLYYSPDKILEFIMPSLNLLTQYSITTNKISYPEDPKLNKRLHLCFIRNIDKKRYDCFFDGGYGIRFYADKKIVEYSHDIFFNFIKEKFDNMPVLNTANNVSNINNINSKKEDVELLDKLLKSGLISETEYRERVLNIIDKN